MPNVPQLQPENQFPQQAIAQSKQDFPPPEQAGGMPTGNLNLVWNIASVSDSVTKWGRNTNLRDRQLRDFWPTETYLAGAMANIAFRNASFDWEVRGPSTKLEQSLTDMLTSALAGDTFGWSQFIKKGSQDLYGTDNGWFIELIRDPGLDANSAFKAERAPVIGIGHLDSRQCQRTGNPTYPVIYTDRLGIRHKLQWYEVIPFSDFPSAIETMNGVGICAVSRALRMAQIMRSIAIFKDERISGRHFKQIHLVGGVSRTDIDTAKSRGREEADNAGLIRFIEPAILASLDPEKPVSVATIDLAGFPDGFNFDQEMQWYISGLALAFATDYQEFAPLPGGNIGSSQQSMILSRKSSGKGPASFMREIPEAFRNYGVMPRGCELVFQAKDMQEELEKQTLRKLALEEAALAMRNGILTPEAMRDDLVRRAIYDALTIAKVPADFGLDLAATTIREQATMGTDGKPVAVTPPAGQPTRNMAQSGGKKGVGQTGGNTLAEDAGRTPTGAQNNSGSGRLQR